MTTATTTDASKRASFTASTCDNPADFFTRLCAEATALAFDLSELANGSVTRLVRGLSLCVVALCLIRQSDRPCDLLLSTSLHHAHTFVYAYTHVPHLPTTHADLYMHTHTHTCTYLQDRRYNLGLRFIVSIELREAQVLNSSKSACVPSYYPS